MKIDWNRHRVRLAYGAFAAVAFVLALRWTFPSEAVKERLIMEAGQRGWQIDAEQVSAGGVLGIRARGIKLETASGLAIPVDDLTASLRLLPLLIGRRSVAFDAQLYDGRVRGTADLSGDQRHVTVEAAGVDLARALPLRKAAGLDLLGILSGEADLVVPAAPDQRPTGRVDVSVKDAGFAGGQLPLPGMTSGLTLPKTALGSLVAAVKLADGKATFERLEATGGDAELRGEGVYFVVQPRMEFAPLSGKAKVKVKDAFWSKSGTQSFKALADAALASSRGPDGAWNFAVSGSVGHPRLQPTPPGAR
jgi:type II secretion system protein N